MDKTSLKLNGITKSFPGVKALDKVKLDAYAGEVLALVGENGAGKSTLMKILSGIYQPDEGTMEISGEIVSFSNVRDAKNMGVSIIHQELNTCNNLKVYQNMFAGNEKANKFGFLDNVYAQTETKRVFETLNINIDPNMELSKLTVSQKQMVEIARALIDKSKILIMDEPTSALSDKETKSLFTIIEQLKKDGVTIIYISHKMEEIFAIADRISVFRDGKYIDTMMADKATPEKIISLMVGRELSDIYPKRESCVGDYIFEAKGINVNKKVNNASIKIRKGEIVGLYGLVGAGRSELVKAIFGAIDSSVQKININGKDITIKSPIDAIKHGIGLATENRKEEGLCLGMTVAENTTMSTLGKITNALGLLNKKQENTITSQTVKKLSIKCPSIQAMIKNLSGGNQQKVVIGRWLLNDLNVLILDEPTRGVDVGAKHEIYLLMNSLTQLGLSIIMISSELPEIIGMSDRVMVMREGDIVAELEKEDIQREKIMSYAASQL